MPTKTTEKKQKPNLRYQRDKDAQTVKGIFKYYEVQGGSLSFYFKAYKEDKLTRYDLIDGGIYILPLGVAKHLNKNCWYPRYAHNKDANGVVTEKIGTKTRRTGFQSLEFMDIGDMSTVDEPVIQECVEKQNIIR